MASLYTATKKGGTNSTKDRATLYQQSLTGLTPEHFPRDMVSVIFKTIKWKAQGNCCFPLQEACASFKRHTWLLGGRPVGQSAVFLKLSWVVDCQFPPLIGTACVRSLCNMEQTVLGSEEKILSLQVSVQHVLVVQVLESQRRFREPPARSRHQWFGAIRWKPIGTLCPNCGAWHVWPSTVVAIYRAEWTSVSVEIAFLGSFCSDVPSRFSGVLRSLGIGFLDVPYRLSRKPQNNGSFEADSCGPLPRNLPQREG